MDDPPDQMRALSLSHLEAARLADPVRMAELQAKIATAVRSARSPATLAAYRSDWADFTLWAETIGLDSMPAGPATVAAYVADLADPPDDRKPRSLSTIQRRLAAIAEGHRVAGHPNPATDPLVRETIKGLRRILGSAPKQKKGITTADLKTVLAGFGDRPINDRDRLVLLFGFAGGLRRSEIVAIDVEDVTEHPEGLLIRLRKSKTDQEQVGRAVEIVYGTDPETCPVRAYRLWLQTSAVTAGAVFRAVSRHGVVGDTRLTGQSVALIVKRHMRQLGYDTVEFAGHSLRRGMATTAARNGAHERTIMRTTGHRSATTLRGYIEDASVFEDPASGYLDL